jgi:hypothetical protein
MTDKVLVDTKVTAVDTRTPLYISPADGFGTIITAFTATNCSVSGLSFVVYISSGTGDCALIPFTTIAKNKFSPGSAIVNHVVPAGSSILAENSVADGVNFYITGREQ